MKSDGVTINMKATELYFPFLLFIMLYKMVLTFASVDEILLCDLSLSSTFQWYCLLCCARWFLTFESVNEIIWCDNWKETSLPAISHGNTISFH